MYKLSILFTQIFCSNCTFINEMYQHNWFYKNFTFLVAKKCKAYGPGVFGGGRSSHFGRWLSKILAVGRCVFLPKTGMFLKFSRCIDQQHPKNHCLFFLKRSIIFQKFQVVFGALKIAHYCFLLYFSETTFPKKASQGVWAPFGRGLPPTTSLIVF